MRFILQDDVYDHLPDDWDEKVSAAVEYVDGKVAAARSDAIAKGKDGAELEDICLEARHKAIDAKSSVWRAADMALRKASYDKCWYCETKQDRSDKPVDHFRPKNSVSRTRHTQATRGLHLIGKISDCHAPSVTASAEILRAEQKAASKITFQLFHLRHTPEAQLTPANIQSCSTQRMTLMPSC